MKKYISGFTLIELMIVIAIVACLSMISIPGLMRFLAKAKRTEAYTHLNTIAMAEKSYFAEHGSYSTILSGKDGIGWKPEGNFNYTYGFAGSEGQNNFVGQLKAPASTLSGSYANNEGFKAIAVADIDGDGKSDRLSIDQQGKITIEDDDLA